MNRFTLFSDFNCPFCYALHERLHELQLIDSCAWQGVQHAPHLPRPMKPWAGSLSAELRHEVSVVRRLAPDLPVQLPTGKPNTGPAIEFAAELLALDRRAGMTLVRTIYRAFWLEGRDISEAQVLTELAGYPTAQESSEKGQAGAREWAAAWEATGQADVPLIVASSGNLLAGCVPTEEIVKFFADH
jgi:predicted DsbA family dithiol-disulfide isomerase